MEWVESFLSEIISFLAGLVTGGVSVYIKIKKYHKGNNIAQNGSVAGENINATININNKHKNR